LLILGGSVRLFCDLNEYSFISFENAESSLSSSLAGVSYSRILPAPEIKHEELIYAQVN